MLYNSGAHAHIHIGLLQLGKEPLALQFNKSQQVNLGALRCFFYFGFLVHSPYSMGNVKQYYTQAQCVVPCPPPQARLQRLLFTIQFTTPVHEIHTRVIAHSPSTLIILESLMTMEFLSACASRAQVQVTPLPTQYTSSTLFFLMACRQQPHELDGLLDIWKVCVVASLSKDHWPIPLVSNNQPGFKVVKQTQQWPLGAFSHLKQSLLAYECQVSPLWTAH